MGQNYHKTTYLNLNIEVKIQSVSFKSCIFKHCIIGLHVWCVRYGKTKNSTTQQKICIYVIHFFPNNAGELHVISLREKKYRDRPVGLLPKYHMDYRHPHKHKNMTNASNHIRVQLSGICDLRLIYMIHCTPEPCGTIS